MLMRCTLRGISTRTISCPNGNQCPTQALIRCFQLLKSLFDGVIEHNEKAFWYETHAKIHSITNVCSHRVALTGEANFFNQHFLLECKYRLPNQISSLLGFVTRNAQRDLSRRVSDTSPKKELKSWNRHEGERLPIGTKKIL